MVTVAKEQKGNSLLVKISGSIEESVNFQELIGNHSPEMRINTKGVTRINSVGVKAWIQYFQGLKAQGVKLVFEECSTAIVEQINLISNFVADGVIESIAVPFSCQKCKSELLAFYRVGELKKIDFKVSAVKCVKCGGSSEFDDVPEEYFGFASS